MDPVEAFQFELLPTEVQMLIFDAMDVRTRLTASEVCHRWHQLAITSTFLRNRIQLTVPNLYSSGTDDVVKLLQHSDRQYRKLRINGKRLALSQHVVPLREILDQAGALAELELQLADSWIDEDMSYLVSQLLESAPALKSLSIDLSGLHVEPLTAVVDYGGQQFLALTSLALRMCCIPSYDPPDARTLPNLRHLEIHCSTDAQLQLFASLQNQLTRVKVLSFHRGNRLKEPFLDLRLPRLEELALPQIHMKDTRKLSQFFSVRRPLRVLLIKRIQLDRALAEAIIANYPELTVLSISVDTLPAGALRNVNRLRRLRMLYLTGDGARPCADYFQPGAFPREKVRFVTSARGTRRAANFD